MAESGDPKCWEELNRAIKKLFKKSKICSEDIKIWFFKPEKDVISICTEDIDNEYDPFGDEEARDINELPRWEIYLYEDGTWAIV